MKILFVLPLLSGNGGIQSSLLNLLNSISLKENDVSLCVFGNYISENTKIPDGIEIFRGPRFLEYSLRDFVKSINSYSWLEKIQFILVKLLRRLFGYEKIMRFVLTSYKVEGRYDVAIAYANDIYFPSFIGGANDIVLKCVEANRKIGWIHNEAHRHGLTYSICKKTYSNFDCIVNVSYACKKIFDEIISEFENKSKVVYNMSNIQKVREQANKPNPYNKKDFNLVTVARIDNQQKRIDRVLECCEKLKTDGFDNFKWYVVGDGLDKPWLTELANEKNITDVLVFTGYKSNPYPYLKHADVLVMTSDYEAHSMVLSESLTVGTPIICTNYPAACEVVRSGINGVLVDVSTDGVLNAIKNVMTDKNLLNTWKNNIANEERSNELALKQFWGVMREINE
jgi:glycosyltransferase involved in cell wall biosynthesis